MIHVENLSLQFGGSRLFAGVDLHFRGGECYGVIGANGAGKSTFLKLLSGALEPSTGSVHVKRDARMSVLSQDQNKYDAYPVMDTVLMGNRPLYDIMKEKDALYEKPDFDEADGVRAAELEGEFAEMNGWEAESDASKLLQGLGIPVALHLDAMSALDGRQKVKVLLAQALFGQPDIVLLDEPTNNLDYQSVTWLENFLLDFLGTVIIVSHDRYFLNTVCTHIVDIDYGKVRMYVGNYDFWYESSRLMQQMLRDQNRKAEEKAKEMQAFIARFSANKSKARQATSRRKLLDSLSWGDMPASSRRYPWVGFKPDREAGKDILMVKGLTKRENGEALFEDLNFILNKGDKVAFVGDRERAHTALFDVLMEEVQPDDGLFKWGVSTTQAYFPKDNTPYFEGHTERIIDWLAEYSIDKHETYLRQFLGRMLFSGDDVYKPVNVLSGGERVRLMLSRMMLSGANVLVLDQPTNHLDLESITALNDGLNDFPGTVLLASHDHQLVETVANRIMEITPSGLIDRYTTFDEYITDGQEGRTNG